MLETYPERTLELLNEATLAWVELEYNRARHSEIGCTPMERYLNGRNVIRPSPSSAELKAAFMRETIRFQRRADGTVSVNGKRFELPGRYRTLRQVRLRYVEWDLSLVELVSADGTVMCRLYPQDKSANASGLRRSIDPEAPTPEPVQGEIAPLLKKLMADYAATGLPPAYLPKQKKEEQ